MNNASDELIISALLQHPTVNEAAKAVYLRLARPEFKQKYEAAKVEVIRGVTSKLQQSMSPAVDTMVALMNDNEAPAQVRLNAAKTILEQGDKYTEASDFIRRIEELEAIITEQQSNVYPISR